MIQSGVIPRNKTKVTCRKNGMYFVNEIFYSLQGEGVLTGVPMVFVRFGGCNLRCTKKNAGFDCDTEFQSGREVTRAGLLAEIKDHADKGWVLLTGGEPAMQADQGLLDRLRADEYKVGIETNGTWALVDGYDHVCVSPKSAWHTIKIRKADEVKIVRRSGQELPSDLPIVSDNLMVSPACQASGAFLEEDIEWCIRIVKENPEWRLSMQTHKLLRIR